MGKSSQKVGKKLWKSWEYFEQKYIKKGAKNNFELKLMCKNILNKRKTHRKCTVFYTGFLNRNSLIKASFP